MRKESIFSRGRVNCDKTIENKTELKNNIFKNAVTKDPN